VTQGISKNPLNDISAVYLREIAEGRLKQLEKASALAASDNPDDQDKAREIRVRHDYESLKKQIGSKKKPTRAAVKEETVDEGVTAKYKGKQYKLLPGKVREKMSGKGGLDGDYRDEVGKAKDWVTDKLKLTNTKRDGVKCPAGHQDCGEGFSDWRSDLTLREITSDAKVVDDDSDEEPEITEKKVKNKIKINPTFKENAEEFAKNLGGQLLEVAEVVDNDEDEDGEPDDKDKKNLDMMKRKEKQLKKRMIRMKMMAINQTDGEGIIASYEPDIEGAVEYFYEEGINEEGLEQLIEDIGLVDFIDFIDDGTALELNEERAARKASVRAKKYDVVKKEVDKADAARRKAKKGEYAPSYAKKETDVTVYDDKPSAKKKTPVKKAPAKKVSKKDYDGDGKKETPKAEHRGVRNKKITKAVAKVKKTQPKKKATKQGLGDKIRGAYKAGVKRHRKATQGARVFGKGFAAGAKKAVKFAKDVKKVVSEEELAERLGGKGYQPYTSLTGKKVSGDWEDSDRGAGNKAKKRAGGKVKKKSPTYLAHVHNKEEVEVAESKGHKGDDSFIEGETGSKRARRNLTRAMSSTTAGMGKPAEDTIKRRKRHQEDRGKKTKGTKAGHSGSAYPKMSKTLDDTYPHKKTYRLKQKAAARKAGKKYEDDTHYSLKKKTVGEKLPKSRNEEVQFEDRSIFKKAMSKVFKKKQEDKKPQKAMDAGARAKRLLARQVHAKYVSGSTENVPDDIRDSYEVVLERQKTNQGERQSQEAGRSDYGKISVRNTRKFGKPGEPAVFDLPFSGGPSERGKMITQRRKEGKEKRGVKKVKGMKEDKAFDYVVSKLRKQHGKDAVITKTSKPKPPSAAQKAKVAAERKKRQDADNKAYADRAKKAGYKSTQDYTNVVARYGSEDNYNKGKGLGT